MATSTLNPRSKRAPTGLTSQQKLMAVGLGTVIVLLFIWSLYLVFGSSGDVSLSFDKKADQVQFDVAKAVMTEQNKMKFQGLQILPSADGTKLEIKGAVDKKEDLDELNKIIDDAKGGFPAAVDVKIVPRKTGF